MVFMYVIMHANICGRMFFNFSSSRVYIYLFTYVRMYVGYVFVYMMYI